MEAETRLPEALRARWIDNDPEALGVAWSAALAEGAISEDLGAWEVPCLIYVGAGDVGFHDQARRAAGEIPSAQFISLEELEHVGTHLAQVDRLLPAVLGVLSGTG